LRNREIYKKPASLNATIMNTWHGSSDQAMIDYEFLYGFSRDVLRVDESISWIGITNKFGVLLNVEQREGEAPFLTEEEQEEYVSNSITRDKKIRFELEMGKQI